MTEFLVKINQGVLKGVPLKTELGDVITFNGIPYAEPPIGELRFKDPQPPKSWDGVREASKEGEIAAQYFVLTNQLFGGDDCLYLNVTTKDLSGKKPVMVWIHGGGFNVGSGSADLSRPDYFMQHDIVFVSINYRLGILGFLNMDMESCAGNQGLKDQVFALRAGLFHKAIIQSGVANNPWAFQFSNKQYALKIASKFGNSSTDPEEVVKFLQTIPAQKIVEAQKNIFGRPMKVLEFIFLPTVDDKSSNPFLPKPVKEMIQNGIDVPVMIGFNSHEGMIIFAGYDPESEEFYKKYEENFEKSLAANFKLDINVVPEFSKDVKNFYFKGNSITKQEQDAFIQYRGDIHFVNGILLMLDGQSQKKTPTYLYKYSHNPQLSLVQKLFNLNLKGACHADELTHLFYKSSLDSNMQLQSGAPDYLLMEYMTKMWTDFAKTGNPTPSECGNVKWSSYISDRKSCLHINGNLTPVDDFEEKSWKFWKPIYEKYNLL